MRIPRSLGALLIAALFASAGVSIGCRDRRNDRDHHYEDSQQTSAEASYYNRWEQETHRQHKDLNQRSDDEKREYQNWRRQQR